MNQNDSISSWILGEHACRFGWLISSTSQITTVLSFTISAIQRYLVIVHNKTLKIFDKKYQAALLTCLWIFAISAVLPFLILGDLHVMYWPDLCYIDADGIIYTIALVLYGFVVCLPMVAIPILYLRIWIIVRRAAKITKGNSGNGSRKKGHKSALILFILYLTFAIAFVPYVMRSVA